jgi:RNA polymerase sigma factor (sigma-70 family)
MDRATEKRYIRQYQKKRNNEILTKFIDQHSAFFWKKAKAYQNSKVEACDLYQEAVLQLMTCLDSFDTALDNSFTSYLYMCVVRRISQYAMSESFPISVKAFVYKYPTIARSLLSINSDMKQSEIDKVLREHSETHAKSPTKGSLSSVLQYASTDPVVDEADESDLVEYTSIYRALETLTDEEWRFIDMYYSPSYVGRGAVGERVRYRMTKIKSKLTKALGEDLCG